MDFEKFRDPPREYRPSPFWSLNNLLNQDELRRQVREFAEKGFGGYFMHSRIGLAIPYLSDEWMDCIAVCSEEGEKSGVYSWLYDEDKWPSGFAGGIIPAKNDEYKLKTLVMKKFDNNSPRDYFSQTSLIALFEVIFSSPGLIESFKRVKIQDITGRGEIIGFKVELSEKDNWYNGESYVDLLNPKVTEEFLNTTIESYAKRFREKFGKGIPGIFTDEPNFYTKLEALDRIPWTNGIVEYFYKLNGYNILDKLPLLFFEGEGCNKVRYDFWKTITLRFLESWTIPYSKKCEEYGLKMTGHFLYEDNLVFQTCHIGAAMPHYEYMHIPGVDHLGRKIDNALTLKQCSSIAHQFSKNRVLCEMFGGSGYDMTFEEQKLIADFNFSLGINLVCQHLSLYTLKGDCKRDYPPTISYHQPYWPYYKFMNDYLARASYVCSQGRFYADILVLNPIGSVWATYAPRLFSDRESKSWRYNDAFLNLVEKLLTLHWEFDLGDELVMEKHAKVLGEGTIVVKNASYKVIIVPPSLTWSRATFNLIKDFINNNGKVIFIGDSPTLIDGIPAVEEWGSVLSHSNVQKIPQEINIIDKAISKVLKKSVSIKDSSGREIEDICLHHRVDGTQHLFFFSNKSRKPYDAFLFFKEKGMVYELDLQTGGYRDVEVVESGSGMIVQTSFPPVGSCVYLIDASNPPNVKTTSLLKHRFRESIIRLPDNWNFERLSLNSLTLDNCQYSINDGEWSKMKPMWKVRSEVLEKAGLHHYLGLQPWVLRERGILNKKCFKLCLKSIFRTEVKPGRIYLVLEKPSSWKVFINGLHVATETNDWYWDRQMGKIDISKFVEIGINTIELSCDYSLDIPIEDIYIVGDFAVKIENNEFVLTKEPEFLKSGDWVNQGYPFYSGVMRYKSKFILNHDHWDQVLLRLPNAKGTLFLIHVNQSSPIPICWSPLEADITRLIKTGENVLEIDVVSSLRNTLGPLHHRFIDDLIFIRPKTFMDEDNWTKEYKFTPYGLINGAEIVLRKSVSS
ncbi:MAG: glycosyl hydrolase [Candidatus Hadarchaeum sp.]|uniref:glycosyl hydrolase n=1 Tax=Candidatus Hadarchaeum sp. TaxID=2883567 RepID=UPI00317E808D